MDTLPQSSTNWSSLAMIAIAMVCSYYLVLVPVYNVCFHPLRKYPGPKLSAASSIPWGCWYRSGLWHHRVSELHQKYGHIVRVAPDELSYDIPDAWEEIYSRGSTKLENRRPEWFVSSKLNNIIGANESDHKRMKAILAPGFSKSALMEQEPVIKRHLDLFICQLREVTRDGTTPINFIKWVNYLTFDIIGDLLFGEDFGCVAGDEVMRQWQNTLIRNLRLLHTLTLCNRIWLFYLALPLRDMWTFVTAYTLFDDVVDSRVKNRGTKGVPDKIDFLELMRTGRNGASMTRREILANSNLLTFAGSESSANSTASLLFRIAADEILRAKLLQELRANFAKEDEISCGKAMALPYLTAVIEEGLRLHPVTPNALWRITPKQGNKILGDWLPGGTVLSIHHRVVYRSEHNFKRAQEFIPERWMPHSERYAEFADDRRDAFHPFSYGPRMCPARNLGYTEMSVVLARLLWAFDVKVAEESKHWDQGLRGWVLWDKHPLWIYLEPRVD